MAVFSLSTRSPGRSHALCPPRTGPGSTLYQPLPRLRVPGSEDREGQGGSQRTGWRLAHKAALAKHHNLNRPEPGPWQHSYSPRAPIQKEGVNPIQFWQWIHGRGQERPRTNRHSEKSQVTRKHGIFVGLGCHRKVPQIRWLKTANT